MWHAAFFKRHAVFIFKLIFTTNYKNNEKHFKKSWYIYILSPFIMLTESKIVKKWHNDKWILLEVEA